MVYICTIHSILNKQTYLIDNRNNIAFFDRQLIFILSFVWKNNLAKLLCWNSNILVNLISINNYTL